MPEPDIDTPLVSRLVAAQFPRWADLPIIKVSSAGTDNAIYRLGEDMAVRLPRRAWVAASLTKEQEWLPRLAPLLPLAVPVPLAPGIPGEGFPFPWGVYQWLDGGNAADEPDIDLADAAVRLAGQESNPNRALEGERLVVSSNSGTCRSVNGSAHRDGPSRVPGAYRLLGPMVSKPDHDSESGGPGPVQDRSMDQAADNWPMRPAVGPDDESRETDIETAAVAAYLASVRHGMPLSERRLAARRHVRQDTAALVTQAHGRNPPVGPHPGRQQLGFR